MLLAALVTGSRSIVKAFVNQGTIPHASMIAKIEAGLRP